MKHKCLIMTEVMERISMTELKNLMVNLSNLKKTINLLLAHLFRDQVEFSFP